MNLKNIETQIIKNLLIGFILLCAILMSIVGLESRVSVVKDKLSSLHVPPKGIENFTLGYQEIYSDFLWIQFIQKVNQCAERVENCSIQKKLGELLLRITDLSPQFRIPYALGPLMLTFLINETHGAIQILERAEKYFSQDWAIFYRGATIYLYDVGDKRKAAEYFEKAGRLGAPPWVFALATKLYKETGVSNEKIQLLQQIDSMNIPEDIKKRIRHRAQEN